MIPAPPDAPDLLGTARVLAVSPEYDLLTLVVLTGEMQHQRRAITGEWVVGGVKGLQAGDEGNLWARRVQGLPRIQFHPNGRDLFPITPLTFG